MSRGTLRRRIAAIGVLVSAWGLAGAAIAMAWAFALPAAPVAGTFLSPAPPEAQARFDDIGLTVAAVYAPLAAVLILRRPQPVAALLAVHAVGSGLAAFGVQYGLRALETELPAAGLLAYAGGWAFVPGTFLTAVIPLLLLPGPPPRPHRWLVRLVFVATAIATVAAMTQQGDGPLSNPLAPPWPLYQAALPGIYAAAAAVTLCASTVVAGILVARAVAEPPANRYPLVWLLSGHVFLTASYVITVLPASLQLATPLWLFGTIAPIVGQLFYPSAVLVMGLQHRLRGIDVAVSSVLTTSILAVLAAGGYLLTVTALEALGPPTPLGVFATAAVIAGGLLPARRVVRRRVDRLVYGGTGAPERLVHTLGARVGEIATGAEGLRALASALRSTLRLGSVRIRLTTSPPPDPIGEGEDAATVSDVLVGAPRGPRTLFALGAESGAEPAAVLEATGGEPGQGIGRRAAEAIADLAPVLGTVVRLASASISLEEARRRAAAAQHAERRALRRELHDGLGPALAGAGFTLAAASNQLAKGDRLAAEATASGVADLLDAQTETLAVLARGGTTPVADLGAELRRLVTSFAAAGATVRLVEVDAVALDSLRAGNLLRIASEAILNALRHAGASRVDVTMGGEGGRLLRVQDDGTGLRPGPHAGVGLISMREWAEEGGFLLAWSRPEDGGTSVTVHAVRPGQVEQEVSPARAPAPPQAGVRRDGRR